VDASRAKLFRLRLLHRVFAMQRSTPRYKGFLLAGPTQILAPAYPPPLRERVNNPWVNLLGLAFRYLCESPFHNIGMFLCRVLGGLVAPHGGSPYLRMWQYGRPIEFVVYGYANRGKVDGWRATRRSLVRRSPTRRCYCMILWLWLAGTSCIHSSLV
jgi:hypothetical protein